MRNILAILLVGLLALAACAPDPTPAAGTPPMRSATPTPMAGTPPNLPACSPNPENGYELRFSGWAADQQPVYVELQPLAEPGGVGGGIFRSNDLAEEVASHWEAFASLARGYFSTGEVLYVQFATVNVNGVCVTPDVLIGNDPEALASQSLFTVLAQSTVYQLAGVLVRRGNPTVVTIQVTRVKSG